MEVFPQFGAFVMRATEKDGRTCINGLPVASPSKQMLGRFPVLQSMKHDNLATYLHFSETVVARDLVIVVTEHFKTTLESVIMDQPLNDESKDQLFVQIAAAVDHLHFNSISHGFLDVQTIYVKKDSPVMQVKLSCYGLPFLTNHGKDAASTMNFGTFLAPELLLDENENFFGATYQSDVWSLGIVLMQVYLGLVLDREINEEEYLEILTKNVTNRASSTVYQDILGLLTAKNRLIDHKSVDWIEVLLNQCLQVRCDKRLTIPEAARIIREHLQNKPIPQPDPFRNVDRILSKVRERIKDDKSGFEKLSVSNWFHLWKMCGSTPETILLKKGVIQNHAPIASYPCIRYDDFVQTDSREDIQSTFELGVIPLPDKRTVDRVEPGQKVSLRPFHRLLGKEGSRQTGNILYDTSSDILTIGHLIDGIASMGIAAVIPRIADIKIVSTQRSEVWCGLLDVTEAKWGKFLDLDVLSSHPSDRQLEVDIPRCHQYDSFMTTPAVQESLRKVLKGWQLISESDNYVYWQGCDSLATPFLLANISKPHVAYACFEEFIYRYCYKFYLKDNSEVIKEYLGIFYLLVAYTDPVLYKHLKYNGFDAELFAIPWFLTCFAHELPLSKLVQLWDETMLHGSHFPLMIALAMLNRLRDKLLAVSFNEMIIIIHDQPDLNVEDVIKNARAYEKQIPPSCTFRAHASPWKEKYADELHRLPVKMLGLPLPELARLHCPRLSSEELIWRLERNMVFVLDTRNEFEFKAEHLRGSYNHPANHEANIEWLRLLPEIVRSEHPKCVLYGKNDRLEAEKLAEVYVMKGVPFVCILHEPYEQLVKPQDIVVKP